MLRGPPGAEGLGAKPSRKPIDLSHESGGKDEPMTGMLVNGEWRPVHQFHNEKGTFERKPTTFRGSVAPDTEYAPEAGRYHLYVSYACPWAHRTLIVRKLRKLDDVIGVSVVHPIMGDDGWTFEAGTGVVPDPHGPSRFLRDVYLRADRQFTGRITVPVLWDAKQNTIVNNESREIIRMFSRGFLAFGDPKVNLCPEPLEADVDAALDAIYNPINNGVYRAGFAGTQAAYDTAVSELFDALEHWDSVLSSQRYVCGDTLTEADICLFTTLVRFDLVYHTHFKCNVKRIVDFTHLWGFAREMFQLAGVSETTHFDHITQHYYRSHPSVNPKRIVPKGPSLAWTSPHGRDQR